MRQGEQCHRRDEAQRSSRDGDGCSSPWAQACDYQERQFQSDEDANNSLKEHHA